MIEKDLKTLEDAARRLESEGWAGQARWLEHELLLARLGLKIGVSRSAQSTTLPAGPRPGQGRWSARLSVPGTAPVEAREFPDLGEDVPQALELLADELEDLGRWMTAHRLRTLSFYLDVARDESAVEPGLDTLAPPLAVTFLTSARRGYPFEAAGLHLMAETTPDLFQSSDHDIESLVEEAFEPWTWATGRLAMSGIEPSHSPAVPHIETGYLLRSTLGVTADMGDVHVFIREAGLRGGGSVEVVKELSKGGLSAPDHSDGSSDGNKSAQDSEIDAGPFSMGVEPDEDTVDGRQQTDDQGKLYMQADRHTKTEQFLFRLDGKGTRGRHVEPESSFELRFERDVPGQGDIPVKGRHMDDALEQSEELRLTVHAPGFTFDDGQFSKPVMFKDGQLEPVVFYMTAPTERQDPEHAIWLRFSKKGNSLYQVRMDLQVGPVSSASGREGVEDPLGVVLDLDTIRAMVPAPRQASLTFSSTASGLAYNLLLDGRLSLRGETQVLGRDNIVELLAELKELLQPALSQKYWGEAWDLSLERRHDEGARKAADRMATAGSRLWSLLAEDAILRTCLERIDALPDGSRIQIGTEQASLPWELMNPTDYEHEVEAEDRKIASPQLQRAWGYRFLIESLPLVSGIDIGSQVSGRVGPTRIAMIVNPAIDEEKVNEETRPVHRHRTWAADVGRGVSVDVIEDGEEAKRGLSKAAKPWTLIYCFCHGSPNQPGHARVQEMLVLDGDSIKPSSMRTKHNFSHNPIFMLNSCSSGAFSPLSFDNFFTAFVRRGASGLVTTHFPVPTMFAAELGKRVLSEYMAAEKGIGEILYDLRRELMERGHPLGLLYAVQCPLEAKAPGGSANYFSRRSA